MKDAPPAAPRWVLHPALITAAFVLEVALANQVEPPGFVRSLVVIEKGARAMLVESQPKLFYFTDHYRDYPMVLIRLSKAKRATVEPLLWRHWRTLASKKAVKEFDLGA